jgi:hypothetical protein
VIGLLLTGSAVLVVLAVIALVGALWPARCDHPGCSAPPRWQATDGGPGGLCDLHAGVYRPLHLTPKG